MKRASCGPHLAAPPLGGRRRLLVAGAWAGACAGVALAVPPVLITLTAPAARAQGTKLTARVGLLGTGMLQGPARKLYTDALRAGLRRYGWEEGRNLTIITRYSEEVQRVPAAAAELVAAGVDVLVVTGTYGAVAARDATSRIPIVFVSAQDPVETGLAASLSRPGANLTGIALNSASLQPKLLQMLKEAMPAMQRAAFLSVAGDPTCESNWDQLQEPARRLGLKMQKVELSSAGQFAALAQEIGNVRAEALIAPSHIVFADRVEQLAAHAQRHGLALVQQAGEENEAHSLFSYGPSMTDAHERAGHFVDRLLRGASPATLPIEQPERYELVLNMKVARRLGITFPRSMVARADRVIE
jgi:putative ABC transport system substrate-binding protein